MSAIVLTGMTAIVLVTVLRRYSRLGWLTRLTDAGARTRAASGVLTAAGRSLAAQPGAPDGLWTSTAHHPDRPRALLLVTRRRSAMKAVVWRRRRFRGDSTPKRSKAKAV